jgi:hypothetical protein
MPKALFPISPNALFSVVLVSLTLVFEFFNSRFLVTRIHPFSEYRRSIMFQRRKYIFPAMLPLLACPTCAFLIISISLGY